jgi:hypothetical protein
MYTLARLNPFLKLREVLPDRDDMDKTTAVKLFIGNTGDSALLDKRILELRVWPHMYLTEPPCTCAHIDVEYAVQTPAGARTLRVRRTVYEPSGVTFGVIHDALHEKGFVATYRELRDGPWLGAEACLTPDTTLREQLEILEKEGFTLSLTPERAVVGFCCLFIPDGEELEKMRSDHDLESSTWA